MSCLLFYSLSSSSPSSAQLTKSVRRVTVALEPLLCPSQVQVLLSAPLSHHLSSIHVGQSHLRALLLRELLDSPLALLVLSGQLSYPRRVPQIQGLQVASGNIVGCSLVASSSPSSR